MAVIKEDTFTETINTALESHTSDSGGGWAGSTAWTVTRFDIDATTDEVEDDGTDTAQQWAGGNESSASTNGYCEVNGKTVGASGTFWFGAFILGNDASDNCYWGRIAGDGGLRLYSRVAGANSQLGSTYTISGFNAATYYDFAVDKQGTTIRALLDGTEVVSVTDTAVVAAGEVGITIRRTSAITYLYADDGTYPSGGGGETAAPSNGSLSLLGVGL